MQYPNLQDLTKPTRTVLRNGWIVYTQNGKLHRLDGPAVISPNHKEYHQFGHLHRDDGPARLFVVAPDGQKHVAEWWKHNHETKHSEMIDGGSLVEHVFMEHWHKAK